MTTRSAGHRFHENVHGVYFDDLDALNILHNSRYLLLVERTIGAFWQRVGAQETHLVRTNAIEYERPVTGQGEVRVRVWVEKLGTTSLVFGFCLLPMDEDVDYAGGSRAVVCVDPDKRTPTPWTEATRKALEPFVRRAP